MNQQYLPVLIFAVNKSTQAEDLAFIAPNITGNVKCLAGSWEGKVEWSYLVDGSKLENILAVQSLAFETDQDSILYLDNERQAYLLNKADNYQLTKAVHIGRFIECSEKVAKGETGFTCDYEENKFYIVA